MSTGDPAAPLRAGPATNPAQGLYPAIPVEWTGSEAAFLGCLDAFASTLLESIARRCDAAQRFDEVGDAGVAFNAGVVAATRMLMEAASAMRHALPGEPASD